MSHLTIVIQSIELDLIFKPLDTKYFSTSFQDTEVSLPRFPLWTYPGADMALFVVVDFVRMITLEDLRFRNDSENHLSVGHLADVFRRVFSS